MTGRYTEAEERRALQRINADMRRLDILNNLIEQWEIAKKVTLAEWCCEDADMLLSKVLMVLSGVDMDTVAAMAREAMREHHNGWPLADCVVGIRDMHPDLFGDPMKGFDLPDNPVDGDDYICPACAEVISYTQKYEAEPENGIDAYQGGWSCPSCGYEKLEEEQE